MPSQAIFLGYARVSTDEQAVSGLSLQNQERSVGAFAVAKGQPLSAFFVDGGVSGLVPPAKRPGFSDLLRFLATKPRGAAITVLVYRLDRVGRSAREVLNLEHDLRRRGVQLASVTENFDSSTPGGKAYLGLLTVFAEYEAGLIGERTYVAMRAAIAKGTPRVGGPAPIGYSLAPDGSYRPDPAEVRTIEAIFATFLATRSFSATARQLNAHPLFTRAGRPWTHATVSDVIRNVALYAGTRTWGRQSRRHGPRPPDAWQVVPNAHEPLLSPTLAARTIRILEERARRRLVRRSKQEPPHDL